MISPFVAAGRNSCNLKMFFKYTLVFLNICNICNSLHHKSSVNLYQAKGQGCSSALLKFRQILTTGDSETNDLDCVRRCANLPDCGVAIIQTRVSGISVCTLMSFRSDKVASQGFSVRSSGSCRAFVVNPCQNGGKLFDGVCKCTMNFAGRFCEYPNPTNCNTRWTKIFEVFNNLITSIVQPTLFADMRLYFTKVRFRDKQKALTAVMRNSFGGNALSTYVQTHSFVDKSSWNSYSVAPRRCFINFPRNHSVATLCTRDKRYNVTSTINLPYVFIGASETQYQNKIQGQVNNWIQIRNALEAGHELRDLTYADVQTQPIIIFQQAYRYLVLPPSSRPQQPPKWRNIKQVLGGSKYTIDILLNQGTAGPPKSKRGQIELLFNPCWIPIDRCQLTQAASPLTLDTFLKRGHAVRIAAGSIYHRVIEVMQIGEEFAFLVAPYMDSYDTSPFWHNATQTVKTLVTSSGRKMSCVHVVETDTVVDRVNSTGVEVGWYVDTRSWAKVYAVFSNASVADGSLSDLASGVLEGRDVRVWIEWLGSNMSRYMGTQWNAVADNGKVSSESLLTWNTQASDNSSVTLSAKCDYEQVLVSSDGRVEVVTFNIWTPGTVEVLTDVLITWFIN